MSTDYRDQIREAVDAIRITSLTSYAWFGRRSQPLPSIRRRELNEDTAAACLTVALEHQLYSDFYTQGRAMPVIDSSAGTNPGETAEFTRQLSAANCGTGYWDEGWQIKSIETSEVAAVTKNHLTVQAEFRSLRPRPQKVGQAVAVYFPSEETSISPGYYVATGVRPLLEEGPELFRLYWNLAASDAIWLMRRLTASLREEEVAFRFKTLKDPSAYQRADAAVLYFSRQDVARIRCVIGNLYRELPKGTKTQVPALTLALMPGLGFAEDPGRTQSFGLHRCRLIAEALVLAYRRGAKSIRERIDIIESRFLDEGVLFDRPYLNRGSAEPGIGLDFVNPREIRKPSPVPRIGRDEYLVAAAKIGTSLCQGAFWYRDACTWVGVVPDPNNESETLATTECRTLGPDLYSGTSGIALFLSQLHTLAPSEKVRQTALGAMRHALLRANATEPYLRLGLYTGSCGIVLAGLRVAHLLRDEEIESSARKMAGRILKKINQRNLEPDLLSGKAGIVISLLLIAKELGAEDILQAAVRLGDQLLRDARLKKAGMSWPSTRVQRRKDLTGFSHGAAGIALALLELSAVVREERFAVAADRAFAYERQHFDQPAGNWRDFRQADSTRRRVFASAWCNGAPGIGLSRMRAWQISANPLRREEAETALLTTRRCVTDALSTRDSAFCLCHGLTGNADILLESEKGIRGVGSARNLIEEAAASAEVPPATPGLMLGQAGIGYYLLRVANPSIVPTALLIVPGWLEKGIQKTTNTPFTATP